MRLSTGVILPTDQELTCKLFKLPRYCSSCEEGRSVESTLPWQCTDYTSLTNHDLPLVSHCTPSCSGYTILLPPFFECWDIFFVVVVVVFVHKRENLVSCRYQNGKKVVLGKDVCYGRQHVNKITMDTAHVLLTWFCFSRNWRHGFPQLLPTGVL